MSNISKIKNSAFPSVRQMNNTTGVTESFADIFTETLENDEASAVKNSSEMTQTTDELLAQTLQDSLMNSMLTSTTSSDMSYSFSGGSGIEAMFLSNAANGEIDDTQLAMFMLYMLMSTSDENSEMSMLYNMMSVLLSNMTGDSQITSDAVGDAPNTTVPVVAGWDYSGTSGGSEAASATAPVYTGPVKSAAVPETADSGTAVLPTAYWQSTTPAVVGSESDRSAEKLREIIDQFDVENAARYVPRDGYTYCNIFLWDVTSALGCEIPHYVDPDTGEPMTYPDVSGAMELNSNRTLNWLLTKGGEYGWREVTAEEAQNSANNGLPAVGVWKNEGGIGHVQVVCPSEDGSYDAARGPAIAQAGRKTLNYAYQSSIYSATGMSKVRYFVHD